MAQGHPGVVDMRVGDVRARPRVGKRGAAWETSARGHRETSAQGAVRPREDGRGRGTPAEGLSRKGDGRRTSGRRTTARGRAREGNASGGMDARPRGGAGATYGRGRGTPTGGHRRRDVGEGDAGAAREMSVRRAPARRTPARRQTREGDAGGGTSATGTPRRRGSARGHRERSVQGGRAPARGRTPAEGRSRGSCPRRASPRRDGGRHGRRRPRRIRAGDAGARGWA